MTLFSAAATLLLIMDPFGNVVMFNSILSKIPVERRRKVLIREVLIAFGVLMTFLLVGAPLLGFLGLEQSSLSLAGGILLFLIAIGMVFPNRAVQLGVPGDDEPFIVPLAIPMIAGPSGIAFLLLLASKEPGRLPEWMAALTAASAISAGILIMGERVARLLGARGMRATERLMGMLLILIAVQMMTDGISLYWLNFQAEQAAAAAG
ncbi:MAG: MarC family protein [Verrucomicrobiia bacterium]|tara:strand:- start:6546 stop:7166 length:621 start_codon:yes stop_codon:yes gene_type:complete